MHSNADGLSRMTYEPTEVPTPALTDALVDDTFVSSVESDFDNWLVQLSSKEEESFQFESELINYTATIGVNDGKIPLLMRRGEESPP